MTRLYKDAAWSVNQIPGRPSSISTADATLSVLMDIRDELKLLNGIIRCPNFLGMPITLRTIEKNTKKRRKKRVRTVR